MRWQSIETLLGPDEHVPYLQFALENFEIMRTDGTTRFPPTLPAECLPNKADDQVMRWHEDCSKRLWKEYITPQATPRGSPRPRSYTGPPAGTPVDNEKYKYAYTHVKLPPGHSFSAQSSPRMRPGDKREREDYFNSKPIPSSRRSRPTTADSGRGGRYEGQRRSSPEEYEDLYDRGRRRSVPKNYYSGLDGSDLPTPGRATSHPASPTERRPHAGSFGASAKDYARRHSHPRHKHAEVETESSDDEEGEADDLPPASSSPQYSKMRGVKTNLDVGSSAGSAHRLSSERMSRHNSAKGTIPDLRYEAASPVGTPMGGRDVRVDREARRGAHMVGEMGRVASAYGNAYGRAHSGLDVPTMGGAKARIYKVHSADEKLDRAGRSEREELRHKHSTSTSGGSRSNSKDGLRESRRSGGVRWVKEVIGDVNPFSHRRHSDSPPNRDREDVRRDDGREKFRREDVDGGLRKRDKERSSDEERRKARKIREREEALEYERRRDRELMSGKRRPEVERRY